MDGQKTIVIAVAPNSQGIGAILTLLFGSLGLLYASVLAGLIMIVVEIITAVLTMGIGLLFTHILCLILSIIIIAVKNKNLTK